MLSHPTTCNETPTSRSELGAAILLLEVGVDGGVWQVSAVTAGNYSTVREVVARFFLTKRPDTHRSSNLHMLYLFLLVCRFLLPPGCSLFQITAVGLWSLSQTHKSTRLVEGKPLLLLLLLLLRFCYCYCFASVTASATVTASLLLIRHR